MSKIQFGALQNWNHFPGLKNVPFHLSVAAESGFALQQLRGVKIKWLWLPWFWMIDLVDAKCVGLEFELLRSSSCCIELMLVLIFLFYLCSAGTYQVGQSPKLTQTTSPSPSPPPHAYTPSLAHSPQQCQGGLLILLPTLSSPASSPQAFEAVPSELRPLTSPK